MRLGLGTAQFGLDYGISNRHGRTSKEEVRAILSAAARHKITVLDTAARYGGSEEVLGEVLLPAQRFTVVTKLPRFGSVSISREQIASVEVELKSSLRKLQATSVYGLLLHDCDDALLPGGGKLFDRMREMKQLGLVKKIGVSAYSPQQIEALLELDTPDLVQVPFNVLDQRFAISGMFRRLKDLGVEVHARSVFLQGALLMQPNDLPPHFEGERSRFRNFHIMAGERGMSPLSAALHFVLSQPEVACCLVGVCSVAQLEEIVASISGDAAPWPEAAELRCDDEQIINPSRWCSDKVSR